MKRLLNQIGKLEVIAFVSGFALMCFELVAARLMAPSIGSSTYVWTSVIGVIIAALAVGYWIGGIVADKRNSHLDVVYLLLASAMAILLAQVLYGDLLYYIAEWRVDPRIQGVAATLLLFAPASFVLGMISPYLAKLNVTSLSVSGRRVASLGALNSIGGIVGTFMTGFVLLAAVGSHQLLTVLVVLMVATSWLLLPRVNLRQRVIMSIVVIGVSFIPSVQINGVVDIDTPSARYRVIDYAHNGRPATGYITGPTGIQSAVYKDGDSSLVFWYAQQMARVALDKNPKEILMLGGGAFTLPQFLVSASNDIRVDAVEIDPELLDIAKKHFNYREPDRVTEYFEDGRSFVNRIDKKYDVIMVDVYGDGVIPFTFTTEEYGRQIDRILADDGIVIVNIIASLTGNACQDVFTAVDAAYRNRLPYGYYATQYANLLPRENIIVVYAREQMKIGNFKPIQLPPEEPFTDDRGPTEKLYHQCRLDAL